MGSRRDPPQKNTVSTEAVFFSGSFGAKSLQGKVSFGNRPVPARLGWAFSLVVIFLDNGSCAVPARFVPMRFGLGPKLLLLRSDRPTGAGAEGEDRSGVWSEEQFGHASMPSPVASL